MDYPSHKNYEKHPGRLERTTEAFRFPGTVTNRTSAAGEILTPFLFFVKNVRCRLSAQLKSEGRCRERSCGHFKVALVSFCGKIRHLTDVVIQRVMTDREHFSVNVYWSLIEMSANRE